MYYYRRIRNLREDNDMTQTQVAEYLGIKQSQYYRYESGAREIPTHLLVRLAILYHTTTDYILELTDKM